MTVAPRLYMSAIPRLSPQTHPTFQAASKIPLVLWLDRKSSACYSVLTSIQCKAIMVRAATLDDLFSMIKKHRQNHSSFTISHNRRGNPLGFGIQVCYELYKSCKSTGYRKIDIKNNEVSRSDVINSKCPKIIDRKLII